MQSHLNRATEIHNLNSIIAGIAIAVSCASFAVGICQKEPVFRLTCSAISFTSLISAVISRRAVRINQNYLQKATDILEQNEADTIYQETRPIRNLKAPERFNGLRSANSPFENEIYLGW
jgi:hypothetical protein